MDAGLDIIVRPIVAGDWPMVWPLLQGMGQTDSESAARSRLNDILRRDDHHLPLASRGTVGVGYAWVQDFGPHLRAGHRTARLHDLYVHPDWRRRGIGRRLFAAASAWAQGRGVRWLQWQASRDAEPFYRVLGYRADMVGDFAIHPFFEIDFGALDG